jgi:hypothetical protein
MGDIVEHKDVGRKKTIPRQLGRLAGGTQHREHLQNAERLSGFTTRRPDRGVGNGMTGAEGKIDR